MNIFMGSFWVSWNKMEKEENHDANLTVNRFKLNNELSRLIFLIFPQMLSSTLRCASFCVESTATNFAMGNNCTFLVDIFNMTLKLLDFKLCYVISYPECCWIEKFHWTVRTLKCSSISMSRKNVKFKFLVCCVCSVTHWTRKIARIFSHS